MKNLHELTIKNQNYELCYDAELKEIESKGIVLKHKKSGARVCLIANEDKNKCFCIGFRTTPYDSTGVPHIIEHSVLCGSEKYPVKDPFIELAKSSLNTFLNAMTYPDKTVYPVASCNDQDIKNLMDVYMDAVLHPNILEHEEIFKQEGWRYELESADSDLTINGVVYNEMKGAYSSVSDLLETYTCSEMFPDTTYGVSSGGDPDVIPTLTYEGFRDFYKKYYHPANSYICLYGDFDMEERLKWLDEEYLSKYDYSEVDSEISLQTSWGEPKVITDEYPIGDDEDDEEKTYYSYNAIIGDVLDAKKSVAWNVLYYALFGAVGAPVRQALMDAGIGKGIMGDFNCYTRQTFINLIVNDAKAGKLDEFVKIINDELANQVQNGINKDTLLAGINLYEFSIREADSGSTPKGLGIILNMLTSWLYDDNAAFTTVNFNQGIFEELRADVETGYFEKLLKEELIDSKAKLYHTLKPVKGLTVKKDKELKDKLAAIKGSLTEEEINKLVKDTAELKTYQESEDSPEAIATLPVLRVADVDKKAYEIKNKVIDINSSINDSLRVIYHDIATDGISYIRMMFDLDGIDEGQWQYISLAADILNHLVNTKSYSYLEYNNEVAKNCGGLSVSLDTYAVLEGIDSYKAYAVCDTKVFTENTGRVLELISELINTADFDDKKRIKDVLGEIESSKQIELINAGHSTALWRAQSYFSPVAYFKQKTDGIDYYEFVKTIYNQFDERSDEIIAAVKQAAAMIFTADRLMVSLTSREDGLEAFKAGCTRLVSELRAPKSYCSNPSSDSKNNEDFEKTGSTAGSPVGFEKHADNEAFKISGQVQYAATAGNYKQAGFAYTGALAVMKTILAYDYLWIQVRVKGGAYGCFFSYAAISGNCGICSYRDPNLKATYEVYKHAADYIRSFDQDVAVEKYIIGTLSNTDLPKPPRADGEYSLSCYISGITNEFLQKERDEILGATSETIRKTADILDCAVNQGYICTVGSEAKCMEDADLFGNIKKIG